MERSRRSFILILLLLAAAPSSARQTDSVSSARQTDPGSSARHTDGIVAHPMLLTDPGSVVLLEETRRAIMFMLFARADSLLERLASRPDGAVAAAYHHATIGLLEDLLFDTEESNELFFERSDELLDLLARQEPSNSRTWLRADAIQQRMWAWAKKGRYVRAALAGNAAFLAFESVLEEEPEFYEAYKGIGLMHMAIGALPKTFRSFLRFFGYSGTLDQGIEELKLAADSSRYSREEALIYLATLDLYDFPSNIDATDVLADLWDEYSGSPLFGLLYGDALIRRRRARESEEVLRAVMRYTKDAGATEIDYVYFFLGEALFRQNRFEEAKELFDSFLDRHSGSALKARAYLFIGEVLEIGGRRTEAEEWYERIVAGRGFDEDRAAARRAALLMERRMDTRDMDLLRGHNDFKSGKIENALSAFEQVYSDERASPSQRGEASYRLARVADVSGNRGEAVRWYRRAIERPGDPHAKWAPWSHYHLARMEVEQKRSQEARIELERLLGYDEEYDFRPSLERKARLMLDRLSADSR